MAGQKAQKHYSSLNANPLQLPLGIAKIHFQNPNSIFFFPMEVQEKAVLLMDQLEVHFQVCYIFILQRN